MIKKCPLSFLVRSSEGLTQRDFMTCLGPECAWYIRYDDESWCTLAFLATRLANIEVILGRRR